MKKYFLARIILKNINCIIKLYNSFSYWRLLMFGINGYNLSNLTITRIHRNTIELLKYLEEVAGK